MLKEYRHFLEDREALGAQLDRLAPPRGREKFARWKSLAARDEWRELVSRPLLEHYDPAYCRP